MPFKKGNQYSNGRPKGAKNKRITVASIYRKVIEKSIKDLDKNFDNMTISERLEQLEKLSRLEEEFNAKQN